MLRQGVRYEERMRHGKTRDAKINHFGTAVLVFRHVHTEGDKFVCHCADGSATSHPKPMAGRLQNPSQSRMADRARQAAVIPRDQRGECSIIPCFRVRAFLLVFGGYVCTLFVSGIALLL